MVRYTETVKVEKYTEPCKNWSNIVSQVSAVIIQLSFCPSAQKEIEDQKEKKKTSKNILLSSLWGVQVL